MTLVDIALVTHNTVAAFRATLEVVLESAFQHPIRGRRLRLAKVQLCLLKIDDSGEVRAGCPSANGLCVQILSR